MKEIHPRNIPVKFLWIWLIGEVACRKIWTDGWRRRRTVSDHKSSPCTSCIGELRRISNVQVILLHNFLTTCMHSICKWKFQWQQQLQCPSTKDLILMPWFLQTTILLIFCLSIWYHYWQIHACLSNRICLDLIDETRTMKTKIRFDRRDSNNVDPDKTAWMWSWFTLFANYVRNCEEYNKQIL